MMSHEDVLVPERNLGKLTWQLLCPVCGQVGVEQMGPDGDHGAVTVHPDLDDYDSPIGTRGGYVKVELFCPDGHGFDLIIANHKGAEYIGVVPAGERCYGCGTGECKHTGKP